MVESFERRLFDRNWSHYAVLLIVTYLALVRFLRYRRRDSTARKYGYLTRNSFSSMTLEDAFAIQLPLAEQEFPKVYSISVFFALFKTYGIPSISRVLVTTGQLADSATASRRAADTGVLLTEIILHSPSSWRTIDGIARMNYLHGLYRKSGKISDDDMLYTLSLFALEPIRWTQKLDWRELTELERCAAGTYWRHMGVCMEIPFSALPSSKAGWRDGLHFLEELETWSRDYEVRCMVPADTNQKMAQGTLDIGLFNVPRALKGIGLQFALALLEPRLRKAMLFDEPPSLYFRILYTAAIIRKLIIQYFALPRPRFRRKRWFSENPNAAGYIHADHFIDRPWYIESSFLGRWGPGAIVKRIFGGVLPGDEGDKYVPQGYRLAEIGPAYLKGKGFQEMEQTRIKLRANPRQGCPFAAWN